MERVLGWEDQEPHDDQRQAWRDALCHAMVPFDLRVAPAVEGNERVRTGDFGPVRVNEFVAPPHEAWRTRKHIGRSDPYLSMVCMRVSGRLFVEQGDRVALVQPGDLTLVDLSHPSHMVATARQLPCSRGSSRASRHIS